MGREALLDQLIPELTGLRLASGKRVHGRFRRDADLPVVLLAGPRGIGKTAVLDRLADGYAKRVPLARLDLADPELSDPGKAFPSPVAAALFRLTKQLAGPVHAQAPLHCLRLNLGLAAVSARSLPPPRDKAVWERAVKVLAPVTPPDGTETGTVPVPDWVSDLPDILSGSPEQRRAALIKAAFAIIAVRLGKIRLSRFSPSVHTALSWYAGRYPQAHGGLDALVELGKAFNSGGQQRRGAENMLLEAFLADVRAAFCDGPRAFNRVVRPLVLLENADSDLGVRLLEAVLERRHRAVDAGLGPDPLVVVGTARDVTRLDGAENRDLDDVRRHTWQRRPEQASGGALVVNLTRLSLDDVGILLHGISPEAIDPDLSCVVYRITTGSPLGASELAGAARRKAGRPDREGWPVTGATLLGLSPGGLSPGDGAARDVLTRLLDRLVPRAEDQAGLVALSLAEDAEEAEVIASACAVDPARLVARCERLLRDEGWADGDGFIGSPFLRTLLRAECARSGTRPLRSCGIDVKAEYRCDGIAQILWNHYRADQAAGRGGADRPAVTPREVMRRVYHELTLTGQPAATAEGAAIRLRNHFESTSADDWLATLGTLAQAPCFLPLAALRDALGRPLAPGQDQLFLVVRRLLLATWYLSDPRVGPDDTVIGVLSHDLDHLYQRRLGDGLAFHRAAGTWPKAFISGHWPVTRTWTGRGLAA